MGVDLTTPQIPASILAAGQLFNCTLLTIETALVAGWVANIDQRLLKLLNP